jgi:hypothetical protein
MRARSFANVWSVIVTDTLFRACEARFLGNKLFVIDHPPREAIESNLNTEVRFAH